MNKIKILILGLGAIFGATLCNVSAAPPRVSSERIFAHDTTCFTNLLFAESIGIETFNIQARIEREEISYVMRQAAAVARTTNHQAKVSAHGRTCRSVATAADYRSKPATRYRQRM